VSTNGPDGDHRCEGDGSGQLFVAAVARQSERDQRDDARHQQRTDPPPMTSTALAVGECISV
jgi:hypothetical protein